MNKRWLDGCLHIAQHSSIVYLSLFKNKETSNFAKKLCPKKANAVQFNRQVVTEILSR